jgi:hypothetical protein
MTINQAWSGIRGNISVNSAHGLAIAYVSKSLIVSAYLIRIGKFSSGLILGMCLANLSDQHVLQLLKAGFQLRKYSNSTNTRTKEVEAS